MGGAVGGGGGGVKIQSPQNHLSGVNRGATQKGTPPWWPSADVYPGAATDWRTAGQQPDQHCPHAPWSDPNLLSVCGPAMAVASASAVRILSLVCLSATIRGLLSGAQIGTSCFRPLPIPPPSHPIAPKPNPIPVRMGRSPTATTWPSVCPQLPLLRVSVHTSSFAASL